MLPGSGVAARRIGQLREHIIQSSGGGPDSAGCKLPLSVPVAKTAPQPLRVVLIGETDGGGYGHGLEKLFVGRSDGVVVAIADSDKAKRAEVAGQIGNPTQYDDWRVMVAAEKPDLVVIAERWSERHFEISKACLEAGAHIFMEKPLLPTMADADHLMALSRDKGLQFTVKHEMQLSPNLRWLKEKLDEGIIGEKLLQIDAYGKMDRRAGGEELAVLGGHIFDLCRMWCGCDALWCSARVTTAARAVTKADVKFSAGDHVGPLIGDEINATFLMETGTLLTYTSREDQQAVQQIGWGVVLTGTAGVIRVSFGIPQAIEMRHRDGNTDTWLPIEGDPIIPEDTCAGISQSSSLIETSS